jgi:type II secretory ATPase GspE/PulE/Tfp pilus assembly ATPase PilB-like protein
MEKNEKINQRLVYEAKLRKLSNTIHSAENINSILIGLRGKILELYEAELVTIYIFDKRKNEIYSKVKREEKAIKEIRIPVDNSSIAGFVALTGKTVNIINVYDENELLSIDPDLSFDNSWDKLSGFKTRHILSTPIRFRKQFLGVIQLVNKKNGTRFTLEDQKLLSDISETLGIAIHNQLRLAKKVTTKFELLTKNSIISEKELKAAQVFAKNNTTAVEDVLIDQYSVSKKDLLISLSGYYRTPYVDLSKSSYAPLELIQGKSINFFIKGCWIPITKKDNKTHIVIDDPSDYSKVQDINKIYGKKNVVLILSLKNDIIKFINSLMNKPEIAQKDKSIDDIITSMKQEESESLFEEDLPETDNANDSSVVILVMKIIDDAHKMQASDIHIEPYGIKNDAEVRFRVDGICKEVLKIPREFARGVISRIKIMADLDIAERRRPQDGKIKFITSEKDAIELRIATIPTSGGNEDIVLRLLSSSKPMPIEKIMPPAIFQKFESIITKPYGIVLVVGPTGSGKTTTLHSALGYINTPGKKIWTAEDPVEISQYRLRQVQVRSKIGLTFAAAMRSFLRADPDVIMVGEMRDEETASIGVEASLTGHLVFSTLHTNSASETIIRLIDMGIDPFNFADALLGILSQRLIRTLCPKCKKEYMPDDAEFNHLSDTYGENFPYKRETSLYKARGCDHCDNTGYKGRKGIYELLVGTDTLKQLIIEKESSDIIKQQAIKEGMTSLLQDGIQNIFEGNTDFHQVSSVCFK